MSKTKLTEQNLDVIQYALNYLYSFYNTAANKHYKKEFIQISAALKKVKQLEREAIKEKSK